MKMKYKYLNAFYTLCLCTVINLNAETIQLESGLRLHYDFNNNLYDSSGNNLDGSSIGNPSYTFDQNNNPNSAISLNGSNQYVYFPSSVFGPSVEAFTFYARVLLESNTSGKIIMKGHETGGAQLEIKDGMVNFGVMTNYYQWSWASAIAENGWHNLVGTYLRNSNISLFIDGTLLSQSSIPESDLHVIWGFYSAIGAYTHATGSSDYFNSVIDDVRIYDRALNTSEIQALGVPEPSALSLLAVGLGGLAILRGRPSKTLFSK